MDSGIPLHPARESYEGIVYLRKKKRKNEVRRNIK